MRHRLPALIITAAMLALAAPAVQAQYLLLLDPTRLDTAVATRGPGPDGRLVWPRQLAEACLRDGVFGPAAFAPALNRCRPVAALAGLAEIAADLQVVGAEPDTTVLDLVRAGGIVAVEPRRRLACKPGACSRELFDDAGYPTNLVGRPQPPPLPVPQIEDFRVDPDALTVGDTAVLSWSAVGVNRCRLESSEAGAFIEVAPSGTLPVEPIDDTVWTLTCAAPGGRDAAQAAAIVDLPPDAPEILLFEPLRDDVPAGGRTALVWVTRQATDCALSDGSSNVAVPVEGRRTISVSQDTRFVLVCVNAVGSVDSAAEVRVTTAAQAPVIESFRLDRDAILRGDGVIATWRAPGATACSLRDPVQGAAWRLVAEGQFRLAPAVDTEYALTCRNAWGSDRAVRAVAVTESGEPLDVLSFELADLAAAPRGGAGDGKLDMPGPGLVRLTWTTQAATVCRIVNDAWQERDVPPSGSRILRIDPSLGLQLHCASRDAEAQALGQVRVLRETLFADNFER